MEIPNMKRVLSWLLVAAMCAATPAYAGTGNAGERFTFEFHAEPLVEVLTFISRKTHIDLVPDASLPANLVTQRMENKTLSEILAALGNAYSLGFAQQNPRTIIVGSEQSIAKRFGGESKMLSEQQAVFTIQNADPNAIVTMLRGSLPDSTTLLADARTRSIMVVASPSVVQRASDLIKQFDTQEVDRHIQTFRIQYAKASDLQKPVSDGLGLAAPYGVTAVPSANSLVVTGTGDAIVRARALISELDQPTSQVVFVSQIIQMTPQNDNSHVGLQVGTNVAAGSSGSGTTGNTFNNGQLVVSTLTTTKDLLGVVNTLISSGSARAKALPNMVIANGAAATISDPTLFPVVSSDPIRGQTVQAISYGVSLTMDATIGSVGVLTHVKGQLTQLQGLVQSQYPIVGGPTFDTVAEIPDDHTLVLAGLEQDTSNDTLGKIALLGDLPLIGGLFRDRQRQHQRVNVLILISCHIIRPDEFVPGTLATPDPIGYLRAAVTPPLPTPAPTPTPEPTPAPTHRPQQTLHLHRSN
jgi:type II secretory pathway component GspD/PulD (secretin)